MTEEEKRLKRNERSKAYYAANKEKVAAQKRQYRFGITPDQFTEMLSKQNSSCAICQSTEPRGQGTFHVDHCHVSGKVRGLLCHHCNVGLGHFREDQEMLMKAIRYLRDQSGVIAETAQPR